MAIDANAPRSRRTILAAALGGAGALLANALGRANPVAAADGDPVNAGETTTATTITVINSDADGLKGISATSTGLAGHSTGPAVEGAESHSTGVIGTTGDTSFIAPFTDQTGVYGYSDESPGSAGVWGDTFQGVGVVGTGDWGVFGGGFGDGSIGVIGGASGTGTALYGLAGDDYVDPTVGAGVVGRATAGATYGVVAAAATTSQYALYVSGKLKISRSGRVSIGSTSTSKKVTMAGVTSASYVVATLQTSVSGCYVRAVVCSSGYFTIYLSKAPGKTVYAGYLVVN